MDESDESKSFEVMPMREDDLDQVLLIEASSFSSPWTEEMFRYELLKSAFSWCLVAKPKEEKEKSGIHSGSVLGYICLWVIGDEMQIANVAVHPSWRRKGIGKALLSHALKLGNSHGAKMAVLEVRVSNTGAQRLYRSFGFQVAGIRKGYYQFPPEDALVMVFSFAGRSSRPKMS